MGSGYKTFTAGAVLTASDVQDYLQDQVVMTFADSTARASAIGTANFEEGMVSYLADTNTLQYYSGSDWTNVAPANTSGLVHINTTTFSGSSAETITAFSADYRNYLIQLEISTMTSGFLNWRVANGGTTAQTNYVVQDVRVSGSALAASLTASQTTARLFSENMTQVYGNINLFNPFLAEHTRAFYDLHTLASGTTIYRQLGTSVHQTATSYAQIQIYPSTGTMTGEIKIFGYRN